MRKESDVFSADTDNESLGHTRPIVATVVAVLILLVLLLPCVLAAASDTIYPRTTVAGISVGGMTQSEAETLLSQELSSAYENADLPITVERSAAGQDSAVTFSLALSSLHVSADAAQTAQAAYENGRSGNFFTSGIAYAKGLLFGHTVIPALSVDQSQLSEELSALAAQVDVPTVECNWRIEGDTMIVTKPKSGYLLNQTALLETVKQAIANYDLDGISCALEKTDPASVTMAEIYTDAHKEASNAYYDKETGIIMEGESSVEFDVDQAQKLMEQAEEGTEFSIPVVVTAPDITKEKMSANLFRDMLGTCTTSVSGSSNRKHNVSLAAKSCNNVILNPGEVFSYNATLGERTAANGYRTAGAYVNGKTVEEYGGGICQISSTLYLATLRSNLEIVSRTNHMFYPGYIPFGMDATVSWGGPDFQFKNNTDYPIKIVAAYANGKSTCTIYGTNVTGNTAKMEYQILSSTAYETVEQEDLTLNPGERKQEQNGYTGYKVATYRCIYDKDGKLISRTLEANSTYKSRNEIILVGPALPEVPAQTPETPTDTPTVPEETTPATPVSPENTTVPEKQASPESTVPSADPIQETPAA